MVDAAEVIERDIQRNRRRFLPGEVKQSEDVNPQRRHEVPVPCGYVNDDAARLRRAMQPGRHPGIEQGENSSGEVHRVDPGQHVKERTADAGGKRGVGQPQLMPRVPLPGKKAEAKDDRRPDPGKGMAGAHANAGHADNGRQGDIFGGAPPRKLQDKTAQQQDEGVDHQQPDGERQWHPVADVVIAGRVPDGPRFAHHVSRGEGNEEHDHRRQRQHQSQAIAAQALAVAGQMVIAAATATSAAVAGPSRSGTPASTALRRSRHPNADSAAHDCDTLGWPSALP